MLQAIISVLTDLYAAAAPFLAGEPLIGGGDLHVQQATAFLEFGLPLLLEFLGSGLEALGLGSGGQEVRSFGRVPMELLAQNLSNFTGQEFRRAQALREQPIVLPGRDLSGLFQPASISGLPSGTVGLFPQLQQFATERTFPGSVLPEGFDPGDGTLAPPGTFGADDDRPRGPGGDDETGDQGKGGGKSSALLGNSTSLSGSRMPLTGGSLGSGSRSAREQAIQQTLSLIQRVLSQGRLA